LTGVAWEDLSGLITGIAVISFKERVFGIFSAFPTEMAVF
jgi:hypothetical protein